MSETGKEKWSFRVSGGLIVYKLCFNVFCLFVSLVKHAHFVTCFNFIEISWYEN